MDDELLDAIFEMRQEIGLPKFTVGDTCSCNLYNSSDIQFTCTIRSLSYTYNTQLYLVDCPPSIGYHILTLNIKLPEKELKALDHTLSYRWTEENTLKFINKK